MRRFFLRLMNLVWRDRAEQELARELTAHLQLLEDEFQRRGMTVEEAQRAARIALGGVEQTKELQREARSFAWIDDARRDLAYGARMIRRNPFTGNALPPTSGRSSRRWIRAWRLSRRRSRIPRRSVSHRSASRCRSRGHSGSSGCCSPQSGSMVSRAYTVARRSHEIGIRIALGARRSDIMGMVLRQGVILTTIGSAIGLLLAAGISQVLVVFLFGVPPLHPPTFLTAALVFGTVGFVACYLPARRATSVDPLRALRRE